MKMQIKKNTPFLIPVIIQENVTKDILMLGYMNDSAFKKTQESGYVWFWSRKRKQLWMKGETSGNTFKVICIQKDCDGDSLLIQIKLEGKCACHTGARSCFYTFI